MLYPGGRSVCRAGGGGGEAQWAMSVNRHGARQSGRGGDVHGTQLHSAQCHSTAHNTAISVGGWPGPGWLNVRPGQRPDWRAQLGCDLSTLSGKLVPWHGHGFLLKEVAPM